MRTISMAEAIAANDLDTLVVLAGTQMAEELNQNPCCWFFDPLTSAICFRHPRGEVLVRHRVTRDAVAKVIEQRRHPG